MNGLPKRLQLMRQVGSYEVNKEFFKRKRIADTNTKNPMPNYSFFYTFVKKKIGDAR